MGNSRKSRASVVGMLRALLPCGAVNRRPAFMETEIIQLHHDLTRLTQALALHGARLVSVDNLARPANPPDSTGSEGAVESCASSPDRTVDAHEAGTAKESPAPSTAQKVAQSTPVIPAQFPT